MSVSCGNVGHLEGGSFHQTFFYFWFDRRVQFKAINRHGRVIPCDPSGWPDEAKRFIALQASDRDVGNEFTAVQHPSHVDLGRELFV